ncbi:hypothetical protein BaRGS_00033901, partial [Batillaria attramentaria]
MLADGGDLSWGYRGTEPVAQLPSPHCHHLHVQLLHFLRLFHSVSDGWGDEQFRLLNEIANSSPAIICRPPLMYALEKECRYCVSSCTSSG